MHHKSLCLALCLLFVWVAPGIAQDNSLPFVSPMFGDNMVLQRGKPNLIWGWAKPGQAVSVEIAGHTAKTVTGPDGRWQVSIRPPAPGGPYTIKIDGPQHVEFHEVLVGDVWLCGGQSNMEFGLGGVRNADREIKEADHPEIRIFIVSHHVSYSSAEVPEGSWKICSPQTVTEGGWKGFSAVAYFFGRRLQQDIHVPVGLVEDCWGGTTAETWASADSLARLSDFTQPLAELKRLKAEGGPQYGNYIMSWYDDYDTGSKSNTWAAENFDDAEWKVVHLPGGFDELGVGDVPSVCWFRKTVVLPDPLPAGPALISLGVVDRMDTTYINGQWVGASAWVENPRKYLVPAGVLRPGPNLITVRVFKSKPEGGFMSPAADLCLTLGSSTNISLAGEWKGAVSVDARPPHPLPYSYENWPVIPTVLYQGMLEPVAPLAITGAIWYQGEGNADRAWQYRTLLPLMISDWRKLFHQGNFPFYIVSLPAFEHHQNQPTESDWAELREAQALTAQTVPDTGLAVTIDTGEPDNIHPVNKVPVGDRLALCALGQHYGEKIVYQGPTFKSLEQLPGALKLHFDHADGGLVVKGGRLGEFSVAGSDRNWHWADARIDGDTVIVSSSDVSNPVAVRYAWQAFPLATLYNGAGLPAVPFRTDNWPGVTRH